MRPRLKSVGLTLLLVGSTAIVWQMGNARAIDAPATTRRSLVLAQSTTTPDRKAEGDRTFGTSPGVQKIQ